MKLLLSLALFFAFLFCPAACADGVRRGLSLAAHEALPALFPFFVASALLVRTGSAARLSLLLARPLARLYGLPPEAAPAVLLGLTGGYPVGAATAAELAGQGLLCPEDAARVNLFCNCASPGFCIGIAGLGVFGSARTGAILYTIHALAALLAGLLVCHPAAHAPDSRVSQAANRTGAQFAAAFCGAVQQAASTAMTVTAFLTFFSVLLALLSPLLNSLPSGGLLTGMLELTNGLEQLRAVPFSVDIRLILCSFLLGFGGLAVQFQVRALAEPAGLPVRGFALAKLLHGVLAAALTALLLRFVPEAMPTLAPAGLPAPSLRGWIAAGAGLMGLLVLFAIRTGKTTGSAV